MERHAGIDLPGDEADHIPDRRWLGVVPIAQAAAADCMHVILVAIERFDRYAVLTVHLLLSAGHPHLHREPGETFWPRPEMSAVDDLGTEFTITSHSGMGGDWAYRLDCEITPAIPERSRRLVLTIDAPVQAGK